MKWRHNASFDPNFNSCFFFTFVHLNLSFQQVFKMDLSPPEEVKPPYNSSSTPLTHYLSRKRKHDETLEFPPSPKFSSTLNESLITDLKDICLVGSVPNTPEKQRSLVQNVVSSPIQESRKILYSSIKVVKPERERKFGLIRQRHVPTCQKSLQCILNINVIMEEIFKYLSGGDLYRFSLVSSSFYKALEKNAHAFARYQIYKSNYKDNKENYVITPPGSPEKCDSPPRTTSENFNKFIKAAKYLNRSQSLTKCRKCKGPAVVENNISQCQNIYSCGLIYCLLCSSSSETGAKDFKDACGHAVLRPTLGNVSNCMEESSYFNFSSQDSGFYSENESPPKVRRNLFATNTETPRILNVSNQNKVIVSYKRKDSLTFVPVVPSKEQIRKPLDGDSPPRYSYAIGSKQSKKNLKRLTR